jgi:hypothetical protein
LGLRFRVFKVGFKSYQITSIPIVNNLSPRMVIKKSKCFISRHQSNHWSVQLSISVRPFVSFIALFELCCHYQIPRNQVIIRDWFGIFQKDRATWIKPLKLINYIILFGKKQPYPSVLSILWEHSILKLNFLNFFILLKIFW